MPKRQLIGLGSLLALSIATGVVAVPSSRHFIRREIARLTPIRFGTASATRVVPVETGLPPVAASENEQRLSTAPLSQNVFGALVAPKIDQSLLSPASSAGAGDAAAPPERLETAQGTSRVAEIDRDPAFAADTAGARQAIQHYRQSEVAAGDEFARPIGGPLRTTLDWVAIRLDSRMVGVARMEDFVAAHPNWPALPWIKRRIEEQRASTKDPDTVLALFSAAKPTTLFGRMALARTEVTKGDSAGGAEIVRAIWRNDDLTPGEEGSLLKEFAPLLRKEDYKYRADRLLYAEDKAAAMRSAVLAGPDVVLLARARLAVIENAPSDAAIAAVPKPLQGDPGLIYSKIQKARRAGKIAEAVALLQAAPTAPAQVIDGDAWWVERRLLARKMLDADDAKTAYAICAAHAAQTIPIRIEAEFHAGWIALRFLHDAKLAAPHFAAAAAIAETPISIARAAYWQARTAQAEGDAVATVKYFQAAAAYPTTFYGQLAGAQLGRPAVELSSSSIAPAPLDKQGDGTRAVGMLLALGERDLALQLAQTIAKDEPDAAQVAATADLVASSGDAKATLMFGKAASQRGVVIDAATFPTFGVPSYQPLVNSADLSTVYAIARQESEFDQHSLSAAGAKGLMQIISGTARKIAQDSGVKFDEGRLVSDKAFNAQLGAALLGRLLADEHGSYILTFAAYNAGAKNVQNWIQAYGDPRKPGVDPVDWIERIPFTETRNYVQRVFENMQVYRARFGMPTALLTNESPLIQAETGKGT